jgi:hypothetical protein
LTPRIARAVSTAPNSSLVRVTEVPAAAITKRLRSSAYGANARSARARRSYDRIVEHAP